MWWRMQVQVWVRAASVLAGLTIGGIGCAGSTSSPSTSSAPAPTTASRSTSTLSSTSAAPSTGATIAPYGPSSTSADAPTTTGVRPVGFAQTAAEVTLADGSTCTLCLWEAATPEERAVGLMGVTDLGEADGMAFLYDEAVTNQFYMWSTPMPLSIGFFAADGAFVSGADMVPCLDGVAQDCPRYGATAAYTTAIELPAGRLDELGIGVGSRLRLGPAGPCPPSATGFAAG